MASLLETVSPGARRFLARQRKEPAMTEPNQQLVEAVARAIADARSWQTVKLTVGDWDDRDADERAPFIELALAAIQATDGECQRLRSALENAKAAIASLPEDGLGMARIPFGMPDDIYPIRDELLSEIDAALKEQSA